MDFFSLFFKVDVSYWAILTAAAAGMAIGFLWHSPLMFGNIWIKLMGFSKEMKSQQKPMWVQLVFGFLSQLVMALILGHLIAYVILLYVSESVQFAFLIWLGFFAPLLLGSVLWEMKSLKLYFINAGYWLVTLIAMSAIFVAWPW